MADFRETIEHNYKVALQFMSDQLEVGDSFDLITPFNAINNTLDEDFELPYNKIYGVIRQEDGFYYITDDEENELKPIAEFDDYIIIKIIMQFC